jgi:molecular chaperone GrpE
MKDKKKTKIEIATPEDVAKYGPSESSESKAEERAPEQAAPGADATADTGAGEGETELQRAERERDEYKDRWLRAQAEIQNQARRLRADRDEAVRYANADFVRALLPVVDDLERSLAAASKEGAEPAALVDGVRIVYDHLLKILSEHHVERIESVGQPFDPTCHEALTQQPSTEHPSGTVLHEMQKGYRLKERLLRPARVIISGEAGQEQSQTAPKRDEEDEP